MCVVSMTGDFFNQRFHRDYPWTQQPTPINVPDHVTKQELDNLRKEVELLRELLIKSKEYDERTGQKDCEIYEKIGRLKQIAQIVGINLDDVLISKK